MRRERKGNEKRRGIGRGDEKRAERSGGEAEEVIDGDGRKGEIRCIAESGSLFVNFVNDKNQTKE